MTTDDLRAWAEAHASEMPQAVAVLELLARCDPMYSRGWCQHCGWTGARMPRAEAAADVAAHTLACDRHPMRAVEDERDALREALTPFALLAADNPDLADNAAVRPDFDPRPGVQPIEPTMADCRRAAELLKGGG